MYLIVGLGNPEEDYSKTRHNMGFNVINKIAEQYDIDINKKKFDGLFGEGIIENQKVILLKLGIALKKLIFFIKLLILANVAIIKATEILPKVFCGNMLINSIFFILFLFLLVPSLKCHQIHQIV